MRYYKPISMTDLEKKIREVYELHEEEYQFTAVIEKDLKKVEFDRENLTRPTYPESYSHYPSGFRQLTTDFPVYFGNAGGDWEFPICFILYWDGSKLRGYIPKNGNAYNKKHKSAYGNHDDDTDQDGDDVDFSKEISESSIIEEILNHIKLKA